MVKVITLGDCFVGKTSLLVRFADSTFQYTTKATISVDRKSRIINIEGINYRVEMWDTAGQERFRTITYIYCSMADAIMLVYDLADEASLQNVRKWMTQIQERVRKDVPVVLVGNKLDLESNTRPGQDLAASYGIQYYSTSAKTGEGVEDAVVALVTEALKKNTPLATPEVLNRLSISISLPPRISRRTSCCK